MKFIIFKVILIFLNYNLHYYEQIKQRCGMISIRYNLPEKALPLLSYVNNHNKTLDRDPINYSAVAQNSSSYIITPYCTKPELLNSEHLKQLFENDPLAPKITIYNDSPLITHINQFTDLHLPKTVKSVNFNFFEANENNYIEFIKKLPPTVTALAFDFSGLDLPKIQKIISQIPEHITSISLEDGVNKGNIREIIESIPHHVTKIDIISNLFEDYNDNDENNIKLSRIFGTFHPKVQEIKIGDNNPFNQDVSDSRLKKVLLQLPFSVTKLVIPKYNGNKLDCQRTIHMKSFRADCNYFPNYEKIANTPTDAVPNFSSGTSEELLFAKAKRLLNDYSKHDSQYPGIALFFSGRWNLHHVDKVNDALKCTNFEDLYNAIKTIDLVNPIGSLARRIRYIESLPEFEKRITVIQPQHNKKKM